MSIFDSIKRLCLALLLIGFAGASQALEIVKWERMPLAIPLQVGNERVIFVDRNVRVGVPSSLNGKLRVQSTGGSIYLLALEPIAPTRIQLQDAETGALILMDIAATVSESETKAPLEPIQIVEGSHTPVRYGQASTSQPRTSNSTRAPDKYPDNTVATESVPDSPRSETPVPVVLTRYAAQNLYAPLRTVEPITGITRVNLRKDLNLKTLLPMLPVEAHALASWRLNDYWVTAVVLKNLSRQVITLDPRLLQGDFIAATFQHQHLGATGDSTDTTVVYLITRMHGLAESLLPALSRFNAQSNLIGGSYEK